VSVAVKILVVGGDCLAPGSTATEILMLDIDTSINCVDINALATFRGVEVLVKGTEGESVPVRDTSQTPGGVLLYGRVLESVDFRVALDVLDLFQPAVRYALECRF
jgi:hypothetical protein